MLFFDALRVATQVRSSRLASRHRLQWCFTLYRCLRRGHREALPARDRDCTAIILSYKRPQNIAPLVGLLLQAPSIRHVVVSNNNPAVKMIDWVRIESSRVSVIEQPTAGASPTRYRIALEHDSPLFVAVDDDVFLRPSQIERLCATLRADPSRPCGIIGSLYDESSGVMRYGVTRPGDADIINQAYAFTPGHVRRFFELAILLGFGSTHQAWGRSTWDDIVISHSGLSKPRICDVGSFTECPTNSEPGIAEWQEAGFHQFRLSLFQRLRALQPFPRQEAAAFPQRSAAAAADGCSAGQALHPPHVPGPRD